MKKENANLGYLGVEFQYRLIKALMEDNNLLSTISPILDQNMFTDINLRTYVGIMKDYYEKHGSFPTYGVMEIKLREKAVSEIDRETFLSVSRKVQNIPTDGCSEIKEMAVKFFRQQNIIRTANQILQIAGNGDTSKYDECVNLLSDAMRKGAEKNLGYRIFDDLADTLSPQFRKTIPTGISKLDEALNGGLGKGELGLIAGSMGFGKTSMSTAMAFAAAISQKEENYNKGFKIAQIVFEDGIKSMRRKYISRITQIEAAKLSNDENLPSVEQRLNDAEKEKELLNDNIRIFEFPTGEVSIMDIKDTLNQLINSGFRPDEVIVDYFECLKIGESSKYQSKWEMEGVAIRKLENLAKELDVAMWVNTQGTKDSVASEVINNDKIGGSVSKTQAAHVIVTISRTLENVKNKIATIAITKNRYGACGMVWNNVKFDNATCTISTDEAEEYEDMLSFHKKEDEEEQELQKQIFRQTRDVI